MVAKYHGIFKSEALFCVVLTGKKNDTHTALMANEVCDAAIR